MSAVLKPMEQGSPEWHEHRAQYRNASETPALMGCSPWKPKTPIELARIKRGLDTVFFNNAMRKGVELEPVIRAQLEEKLDDTFEPGVMVDGDYSASLDGMNLSGDTVLEIKAPTPDSPTWTEAEAGNVPDHYLWQIQHQLMVAKAKRCIFAVGDGERLLTVTVEPDMLMHQAIQAKWDAFWPLMDCDEAELIEIVTREDDDWRLAVEAYRHAKAEAGAAADAEKQAKARLIELANDTTTEGFGVRCIKAERAGSVNYRHKDIKAALAHLNLDDYRGKATAYFTIKEVKE